MKKSIFIVMALMCSAITFAHDFSVRLADGQQLYFNVTDKEKNLVELTFPVKITETKPIFTGKLNVPATVKYNNTVYRVTSVGKKAFVNDKNLTEVILPSGLTKVDDFAFEGCTSLKNIVFPGNKVTFGSGTFFRCTSIENVTLGSDWTTFDMKAFRWSKKLKEINIPAKLEKVTNLKSLKYLEKITVDANNRAFKSIDGVLYNNSGTSLLCCPRAYGNRLEVATGTLSIRWGAIADCRNLQTVILPTTLTSLSYREFVNLTHLKRIVMQRLTPIMTAQNGDNKYFLLTVPNANVELVIPRSAKRAYQKSMTVLAGNYTEIADNLPSAMDKQRSVVPFEVKSNEILTRQQIRTENKINPSDF